MEIPLTELHPPEFHPFQVNDDEDMYRLAMSVKQYGVREPGLARPCSKGGYELLCGNRRKRACELSNISTMPVIVRDFNDDLATIVMVDSNLEHRERILPGEKAWACMGGLVGCRVGSLVGSLVGGLVGGPRMTVVPNYLFVKSIQPTAFAKFRKYCDEVSMLT